jgi:hypothetical protein
MRYRSWAPALAWIAYFLPACSSEKSDCVCTVVNGGERRVLACGTAACVGGTSESCADKDQIVPGGTCTAPPPVTTGSAEPPPTSGGEPDRSCDDLLDFCTTMCTAPAAVAADCESTASDGDLSACAEWPLAEGTLCAR